MAPTLSDSDMTFLVACLKHTEGMPKPDFEKVAADVGAKNGEAAYKRHWALMKKMGLQTSTKGRAGGGTKRVRTPKKKVDKDSDGDSGNEDTPMSKKVKTASDESADEKREE